MWKVYKIFILNIVVFTIFLILFPACSQAVTSQQLKATVQIICKDTISGHWYSGSGTIIDPSGIILTNKHVVTGDNGDTIDHCAIGVIENSGQEPDFQYIAETKYWTTASSRDAAILYIDNKYNKDFPHVDIFNTESNSLQFGDKIEVVGYPSIGGSTLTYTEGVFSGSGGDNSKLKDYLKTTATLGHGNSGGGAYNNNNFIGIPTAVVSDLDLINSIGYIFSITSIKEWLTNIEEIGHKNKIPSYYPNIHDKETKVPENVTPPDISELSVTNYKSIASDFSNETVAFRFNHPSIESIKSVQNDNGEWDSVVGGNIKGFHVYFGDNISAQPVSNGKFILNTYFRLPSPDNEGVYYLIIRIEDDYDNISGKAIYKFNFKKSFSCPQVTSLTNANTGEKFKLREDSQRYAKPIVPGDIPIKFEWEKELIDTDYNYQIFWNSSAINGIFTKENPNYTVDEVKECNRWNDSQKESVFYLPALKYRWQYFARLLINYVGDDVSRHCGLIEINTLPKGANYQKYLLSNQGGRAKINALVKTKNSAGVYLIQNNQKKPIKSKEVFLGRGYKWGDVTTVSQEEMNSYALGEEVTLDEPGISNNSSDVQESIGDLQNGLLVKAEGSLGIYLIYNNKKRPIRSKEAFLGRGYKWSDVEEAPVSKLNAYPEGNEVTISEKIDINRGSKVISIDVPRLRVRSLPSLNGDILTLVSKGEEYSVINEKDGWYKINYANDKTGWAMSKHTTNIKKSNNKTYD